MSKQFFTYDKSNGMVTTSGTSFSPESLATDSIGVVVGKEAKPGQQYYLSGVLHTVPPAPSSNCVWDWYTKQWSVDITKATYDIQFAMNNHFNSVAKLHGDWSSMQMALASAGFVGPFQAQAITLATWWSSVWELYYAAESYWSSDLSAVPDPHEFIASLPVYNP